MSSLPSRLVVLALVLAAVSALGSACRRTERLPPRPEELEAADGAARAVPGSPDAGPVAPLPPRRLSAPDRAEPEKFSVVTADGVTIVGDYFAPPSGGAPVIVLVHGAGGRRTDFQQLIDRLLATPTARPAVVAFDLRGHGESVRAGERTLDFRTLRDEPAAGANSWPGVVQDVKAVLGWVRARPEIGSRAAFVGVDLGAVAAARAAAEMMGASGGKAEIVGLVGLSPAELHGVAFGPRCFPVLVGRGVQAAAFAAEDDSAEPPQGVRAIEAGLGTARVDAEVFAAGGHGTVLLERRPELEGRVLGLLRRTLGGTQNFGLALDDGTVLRGSVDQSLDPGGPAVILVHDVGRDRTSLRKLRSVLTEQLPYDVVVFDLPGYGASVPGWAAAGADAGDGGETGAAPGFLDDVPPEDPRSWRSLVRALEGLVRVVAGGGEVEGGGEGFAFVMRSTYALVGVGMGATIAVEAASELVADGTLPPLGAMVLVSPIANARGMSIWPGLGDVLRPRGVGVFAAAGSRALMTAEDAADGMGSVAKAVRTIAAMFRGQAETRIYTTDAHGEALVNVHADLAPAIAQFLLERLEDVGSGPVAAEGVGKADAGGDVFEPTVIQSDAVMGTGVLPVGIGGAVRQAAGGGR